MYISIWYLKRRKYVSWHEVFTYDMWYYVKTQFSKQFSWDIENPVISATFFHIYSVAFLCYWNCSWVWSWPLPTKSNKILSVVNESSLIKTLYVIYFMIMFECLFSHQFLIQLQWLAEVGTPQGHTVWETYITSTCEKELLAAHIWARGNSSDARVF